MYLFQKDEIENVPLSIIIKNKVRVIATLSLVTLGTLSILGTAIGPYGDWENGGSSTSQERQICNGEQRQPAAQTWYLVAYDGTVTGCPIAQRAVFANTLTDAKECVSDEFPGSIIDQVGNVCQFALCREDYNGFQTSTGVIRNNLRSDMAVSCEAFSNSCNCLACSCTVFDFTSNVALAYNANGCAAYLDIALFDNIC